MTTPGMPALNKDMSTDFVEADHPRAGNGKFADKDHLEPSIGLGGSPAATEVDRGDDVRHLAAWKGAFRDGYTPETIDRFARGFTTLEVACVWDELSDDDFSGDSQIIVRETREGSVWQYPTPGMWSYLCESEEAAEVWSEDWIPENLVQLPSDPGVEERYDGQELADLPACRGVNYAVEDHDACRFCGESAWGGEGADGYCGNCADLLNQHENGEHALRGRHRGECPTCSGHIG